MSTAIIAQKFLFCLRSLFSKHDRCKISYSAYKKPTDSSLISTTQLPDQLITNSRTNSKQKLILRNGPVVTWYCCGPTVYDTSHLGHAFSYMHFDLIRRVLENFRNLQVIFVMNITDIDDKIIARAKENKSNWIEIAQKYEKEFLQDIHSLGILSPTATPKISSYIPQTIQFVQKLLSADMAYIAPSGSVYFDVNRYIADPKYCYGKLHIRSTEPQETTLSSTLLAEKRSASDFALWKGAKSDEPSWAVPFSDIPGRPGWHIECSTVASSYFNSVVDIHSGGIDLAFPHHENEEAQCCAYHGVENWAACWMHAGHLIAPDHQKMSKSLKNFVSIGDFLQKHSAEQFRMFCMTRHYKSGRIFSEDEMIKSSELISKFTNFVNTADLYISGTLPSASINEAELFKSLAGTIDQVHFFLADDFNFAEAISSIADLINLVHRQLQTTGTNGPSGFAAVSAVSCFVETFFRKLGLILPTKKNILCSETRPSGSKNIASLTNIVDTVVDFRAHVRRSGMDAKKNPVDGNELLKHCDVLRENLLRNGVRVKDHGRLSSWELDQNKNQ